MSTLKYFSCILLFIFQSISAQDFWYKITGSLGDVNVTDLCLTQGGILLAYIHWDGLYYTTNDGEQWIRTNYQGYEPNATETINDSIFIVGGHSYVYVSNNYGENWNLTGDFSVWSLYYEPTTQLLYLGTENSSNYSSNIYKSTDFGQSWELICSFPTLTPYQRITTLFVTKNSQIILASVSYWTPPPPNVSYYLFYKSIDNGQSWEIIFPDQYQSSVSKIIEDSSLNLFALRSNQFLVSTDEGFTWIMRSVPFSDCLATDYSGRVFRGLSYTTDQGISWIAMDHSGLQGSLNDMVINEYNRIFLATDNGVYIGEADSIVVSVEDIEPAKTFYLYQNYPNPFNPSTKIKYTVPSVTLRQAQSDNWVTLKVYDVLGNEIATLVNEEEQPGTYEVEFNTSSIKHLPSSGIYFYQLKAGSFVETKKMILLK